MSMKKALWKWVNVEDLDGFLQEVGEMLFGYVIVRMKLTAHPGFMPTTRARGFIASP